MPTYRYKKIENLPYRSSELLDVLLLWKHADYDKLS